jgi:hypothetical protein
MTPEFLVSKRFRTDPKHDGEPLSRWQSVPGAVRDTSGRLRAVHPFDLPRHLHAAAIRAGMRPRSIIESARFEQWLHALESFLLGPLARRR